MKKKNKLVLSLGFIFFFSLSLNSYILKHEKAVATITSYRSYSKVTSQMVRNKTIPKDYLLAMVAIHECINLYPQDAKYIIEATYNRELLNWGNYGDVYGQILSSEFKGLIDKNFYFDPSNKKHIFALECARRVLKGEREIKNKKIVGWLTDYDSDSSHVNEATKTVITTPTYHKFWTNK